MNLGNGALNGFLRIFGKVGCQDVYVKCVALLKYPNISFVPHVAQQSLIFNILLQHNCTTKLTIFDIEHFLCEFNKVSGESIERAITDKVCYHTLLVMFTTIIVISSFCIDIYIPSITYR